MQYAPKRALVNWALLGVRVGGKSFLNSETGNVGREYSENTNILTRDVLICFIGCSVYFGTVFSKKYEVWKARLKKQHTHKSKRVLRWGYSRDLASKRKCIWDLWFWRILQNCSLGVQGRVQRTWEWILGIQVEDIKLKHLRAVQLNVTTTGEGTTDC